MQIEKGTDKFVKTLRVLITDQPGYLGKLTTAIGNEGGNIGDIRLVKMGLQYNTREITVFVDDEQHLQRVIKAVEKLEGIYLEDVIDPVLELHKGGKIEVKSRIRNCDLGVLRKIYTPGVARVCKAILEKPEDAYSYTWKGNSVAIITNGTAILGLGDIGVVAGHPVMEGKAVLMEMLVSLSGIPILVDTRDTEEFINVVRLISKGFGAINLEDIASPQCFEIEDRLIEMLDIPVMHDDQHGTAVVVLAALLNATTLCGIELRSATVGVIGLGAAGMGIAKLLKAYGVKRIIGNDIKETAMEMLARMGGKTDSLEGLMSHSDVVVATTGVPNLIKPEMVKKGQIILALSNPYPEIKPEEALRAGAIFASDGRSVNNALGFPGIFRGALNVRARKITDRMKISAAKVIAKFAEKGELVPSIMNLEVHRAVAEAVERAAIESGVARVME